MNRGIAGVYALSVSLALGGARTAGQSRDIVTAHLAAAKVAAGQDWMSLYTLLCSPADQSAAVQPGAGGAPQGGGAPAGQRNIPDRALWHQAPAKVFDNLYFVGTKAIASWAVTTSQGIILIDATYDYSVEDEVVSGLTTLGLDPKQIKYVLVSHGHASHFGGAKLLQDTYGARVGLTAADWDLVEKSQGVVKPKREMVIEDGQKLALGDTTITMYITPGHTTGALSYLIPAKDKGKSHMVALSGIGSATGADNLKKYVAAAARLSDIAAKANADVVISDEDQFVGYVKRIEAMKANPAGPNLLVVGNMAVKRFFTVVSECGSAVLATLHEPVSAF